VKISNIPNLSICTPEQVALGLKWVEALRSGEYKQGTSCLHQVVGEEKFFCCLGVACDLAKDQLNGVWGTPSRGVISDGNRWKFTIPNPTGDGNIDLYGSLSDPGVRKLFGFSDTMNFGPTVRVTHMNVLGDTYREIRNLADLNDTEGLTFPQIASIIEAAYTGKDEVEV
jgi:hypothetical protein